MKTIVTHKNPHLDEITCIWMIHRFLPIGKKARVKFLTSNTAVPGGAARKTTDAKEVVHIGMGRGAFDEHKGNLNESATTLVYKKLIKPKAKFSSPAEKDALEEIVAYVNDEDHGRFIKTAGNEFSIAAALSYLATRGGMSSNEIVVLGEKYLDGVYSALIDKHALDKDWKRAKILKTKWGKGVAVETPVSAKMAMRRAAAEGAVLVVAVNPKTKFRSIRALNESQVDLSRAYTLVKKLEPKAEWYLHHSKKMLICGSDVAANMYLSKLPLAALSRLITV